MGMRPRDELVLKALVCHPDRSDRDLSLTIGISKSSFSSIRKKLVDSGFITRIGMPAFWRLGWEVLTIRVIQKLRPRTDPAAGNKWSEHLAHDIFNYSDIDTHLGIAAYKTLAEWKLDRSRLASIYHEERDHRCTFIDIPLRDLHIYNMFDYYGMLHCSHECPRQIAEKCDMIEGLSPSILKSLVHISNVASVDKGGPGANIDGSIARYRRRYKKEGLILERNIPGFTTIGKNVLCLHQLELLDNSPEELREIERAICHMTILNLESKCEQVLMTAHEDLGSAVLDASRIMEEYHRRGLVSKYPMVYHISAEDPRPPILPQNIRNMMNVIQ